MSDVVPDTELVEFKIVLDSIWHNAAPKYEVLIDDAVQSYGVVTEKSEKGEEKIVTFSLELPEGDHTLQVRLCDKLQKHTIIDDKNNIIADQLLHIKQIELDEIELDYLFYSLGNFHKQTGIVDSKPVYDETPLPDKYTNIGWNGEYRLKFSVPTYMWFLENL
jgi:hypothetical protein